EVVSGQPPGLVPPAPVPEPVPNVGVASTIPPSWEKPDPNVTAYDGPDGHCGATGDGGDSITNARKNRTDVPVQYHEVSWKALQSLPYPVAKRSLMDWTAGQVAQIDAY